MDILIPDNWLRDFIETKASPKQIAKYLSLCGPSVEKVSVTKTDSIYSIEVTTNRVDTASVYGIAREAAAILPRFGIPARLLPLHTKATSTFTNKVSYLDAVVDENLCPRFTAILIRNIRTGSSPDWLRNRLESAGIRSINNIVDISNYIMVEMGQPVHTFDYDKIGKAKMILRKSRLGETITTLDGKTHKLPGGDIVIEDGNGRLIDLAGIMGGENSAIDEKTKNVLLFVQTYNPINIRKTSMLLAHRTQAVTLFEKGLDPELVESAIKRGIDLFVDVTKGVAEAKILDIYRKTFRPKKLVVTLNFINELIGIIISKTEISKILNPLGFETLWKGDYLEVFVPSQRDRDISIPPDIVEEIARIYGYHNLPSTLPQGAIPSPLENQPFTFENNLKNILKSLGGVEVYTSSLVASNITHKNTLCLSNPLGKEGQCLRTSLSPSLINAANENVNEINPFFLFEMSNVYLLKRGDLPNEVITLGVIFKDYNFRQAKGMLESLLGQINSDYKFIQEDKGLFLANQRLSIMSKGKEIGQFGILENLTYFEFDVENLSRTQMPRKFTPLPKFPPQIEDITLTMPSKTRVGDVVQLMKGVDDLVSNVQLTDIYTDSYTFRIWYQNPEKTLSDSEVKTARENVLKNLKKIGVTQKVT